MNITFVRNSTLVAMYINSQCVSQKENMTPEETAAAISKYIQDQNQPFGVSGFTTEMEGQLPENLNSIVPQTDGTIDISMSYPLVPVQPEWVQRFEPLDTLIEQAAASFGLEKMSMGFYYLENRRTFVFRGTFQP